MAETVREGEICGCVHVAAIVLDLVLVGTRWAISLLLCTDRIRKSSHLAHHNDISSV